MSDHLLALFSSSRRVGIAQPRLLGTFTLAALVAFLHTLGAPSYIGG